MDLMIAFVILLVIWIYKKFKEEHEKVKHHLRYTSKNRNIPRQNEIHSQIMKTMSDMDGSRLTYSDKYPRGYANYRTNGRRNSLMADDFTHLTKEQCRKEGFEYWSVSNDED